MNTFWVASSGVSFLFADYLSDNSLLFSPSTPLRTLLRYPLSCYPAASSPVHLIICRVYSRSTVCWSSLGLPVAGDRRTLFCSLRRSHAHKQCLLVALTTCLAFRVKGRLLVDDLGVVAQHNGLMSSIVWSPCGGILVVGAIWSTLWLGHFAHSGRTVANFGVVHPSTSKFVSGGLAWLVILVTARSARSSCNPTGSALARVCTICVVALLRSLHPRLACRLRYCHSTLAR